MTCEYDEEELVRARRVDTTPIFGTRLWLRTFNISQLVHSQARSRFISDLATEFRRLRAEMSLDDDEYVELMARAVQAIPYGEVREVSVIEGKGFGFIEMSSQSEAEAAKKELNESFFKGRTIRVDEAKPPRGREGRRRR